MERVIHRKSQYKSLQIRHAMITFVLPLAVLILLPLGLHINFFSVKWFFLLLVMWWLTGCLGISIGFHRLFAHRAIGAPNTMRYILGFLGQMAGQGNIIYWVSVHRHHHGRSDKLGDIHSPHREAHPGLSKVGAFFRGHIGWIFDHEVPNPMKYSRDLVADRVVIRLSKQYYTSLAVGFLVPGLVGLLMERDLSGLLLGVYWGGVVRILVVNQIIWSINSICHYFGSKTFATRDESRNVWWLSLLSWGESWHNNHHACPSSARFGFFWWQIDPSWWCVRLMVWMKLFYDVKEFSGEIADLSGAA